MYPDFFWSWQMIWFELLHVEDPLSKVVSTTYPFIILHLNSNVTVIPFEMQKNGTYNELVLAWPRGFHTLEMREEFLTILNVVFNGDMHQNFSVMTEFTTISETSRARP